jgi:hypothetical protein
MSFFSGGGGQTSWPTDYPFGSPQEQAAKKSADVAQQMLNDQRAQAASNEAEAQRVQGLADAEQAKTDATAAQEESLRQQRIRGGGIQRFMTAGYSGYGDSRSLGTATTLGG